MAETSLLEKSRERRRTVRYREIVVVLALGMALSTGTGTALAQGSGATAQIEDAAVEIVANRVSGIAERAGRRAASLLLDAGMSTSTPRQGVPMPRAESG